MLVVITLFLLLLVVVATLVKQSVAQRSLLILIPITLVKAALIGFTTLMAADTILFTQFGKAGSSVDTEEIVAFAAAGVVAIIGLIFIIRELVSIFIAIKNRDTTSH